MKITLISLPLIPLNFLFSTCCKKIFSFVTVLIFRTYRYTCDEAYWYDRKTNMKTITCQADGSYKPPLSSLKCIGITYVIIIYLNNQQVLKLNFIENINCIVDATCDSPGFMPNAMDANPKPWGHKYSVGKLGSLHAKHAIHFSDIH